MRSFKVVRFACVTAVVLAFSAALSVSAQEMTPEPTEDLMMQQMMSLQGACPEGAASAWLDKYGLNMATTEPMMGATEEMGMSMTEMPMAEATEEMGMATTEPMMGATETPTAGATEEGMMGAKCLYGEFSGAAEVPETGDPDAYGIAYVSVDQDTGDICYDVAVMNLTLPAAAMHIHQAVSGVSGDVVVPFSSAPDASGVASGCTTADVSLAQQIASDPAGFYVNVHTSDFPKGAARAQLATADASMTMPVPMAGATEEMEMMTPEPTTAG